MGVKEPPTMTARTQVLEAIEHMKPQELLRVADFIEAMRDKPFPKALANGSQPDYQAVRKALSGLKVPMSAEIIQGREDRV
jgi:hypothetical protein